MAETPKHLLPENCFICGNEETKHGKGGHTFWSNADAKAEFDADDARMAKDYQYPDGTTSVESYYVNQTRGY